MMHPGWCAVSAVCTWFLTVLFFPATYSQKEQGIKEYLEHPEYYQITYQIETDAKGDTIQIHPIVTYIGGK